MTAAIIGLAVLTTATWATACIIAVVRLMRAERRIEELTGARR